VRYEIREGLKILREEGLKAFVHRVLLYIMSRTLLGYIFSPYIVVKFRNAVSSISSIREATDFAFSFQVFCVSIKPAQIRYEIAKLLEIVVNFRPRVVLEIGTAGGGTLFLFARAADPDAKIISIDLPGGPFGGGYPRWKIPLYKSFSKEGQEIYLIRRDSHDPQTLHEVKRILGGERVDLLFIDGDHTYLGVKRDFEMYSPLVREGGIIAFHDIVPGPPENVGGVPEFWNQIKAKYEHLEIVRDWSQGGFGIGVLFVSSCSD
jgi:predicted O-methyltransferase YrrM